MVWLVLFSSVGCSSFQPFQRAKQFSNASKQWTKGGIEALHQGRLSQAKSLFSRATIENPADQTAHINLARTLQRENDLQPAIKHLQQGLELSGNRDPKLMVELGELYLQAGQWLPAKRQAELVLELDPRFAPAWALQGRTNLAKGDLDLALADFQRAAGIDHNLPGIQLTIVQTYQRMNQPLRALSAVEQLLSQYPPDQQPESALVAKSMALMELKQVSPAIELLQAASEREDVSSEVYLRLSQAQLFAGQASQARLTLNRAKLAFPGQTQFDSLLADLHSDAEHVASR